MAVPFTFGQALLQGLEQGQGIRQQRDELAFRKDAQEAAQTLAREQFNASTSQFDRAQKQREFEFGVSSSFDAQNIGFQNRQTNLAEEAQRQTFSRFVDLQTPDGQTAQIDIRDLLGDQREQERISLQRRALNAQYQPFTITDDQRLALGNLLSGQQIPGGSVTLPYQLADTARGALSAGIDPIAQVQRKNYLDAVSAESRLRDFSGQVSEAAPLNPSGLPQEPTLLDKWMERNPTNSFVQGMRDTVFSGSAARRAANSDPNARSRATSEFLRVANEQEDIVTSTMNLPPTVRGQAAAMAAERSSAILADAQQYLRIADIPDTDKRNIAERLWKVSQFQAANVPQTDPLYQHLNKAIELAMEEEDYATVAKLSGELVNLSKASATAMQARNKADLQALEFQTGGN